MTIAFISSYGKGFREFVEANSDQIKWYSESQRKAVFHDGTVVISVYHRAHLIGLRIDQAIISRGFLGRVRRFSIFDIMSRDTEQVPVGYFFQFFDY